MSTLQPQAAVRLLTLTIALLLVTVSVTQSQKAVEPAGGARTDTNVVYGMYSGLALLMDIHRPARPNGRGIVLVPGSGWAAPTGMSAPPLKNHPQQVPLFVSPLVKAGYTVFVIDHRAAPRFHYPNQFEDAARAVRFIRHHAARYGVDGRRLGGLGYSSGANLIAMLGVKPDEPSSSNGDPIEGESARLQCIVAVGTPADLTSETTADGYGVLSMYLGVPVSAGLSKDSPAYKLLVDASPLTYVTSDDAPMLFVGGNQDRLVPTANARRMVQALQVAGVRSELIEIDGATHWPISPSPAHEYRAAMVRWLGECLDEPSPR